MDQVLEGYLSIGQVLRPQGLRGQVKIRPDTDDPGRFSDLKSLFIQSGQRMILLEIRQISVRGGFVFLNLGEDKTLEDAENRRGMKLYVRREDAVPLKEHENFIVDIIGCTMKSVEGKLIGTVTDVLQPGANDVYVVQTTKGVLLVPALQHVVLDVDAANKQIIVQEERLWEVSVFED